jgi:hypothetical protein
VVGPTATGPHRRGDGTVFAKVSPAGKRSDIGGAFSALPEQPSELIACRDDDAHHVAIVEYTASRLELTVHAVAGGPGRTKVVDRVVITASP